MCLLAESSARNVIGLKLDQKRIVTDSAGDLLNLLHIVAAFVTAGDGFVPDCLQRRGIRLAVQLIGEADCLDFNQKLRGSMCENAGSPVIMRRDFAAQNSRGRRSIDPGARFFGPADAGA